MLLPPTEASRFWGYLSLVDAYTRGRCATCILIDLCNQLLVASWMLIELVRSSVYVLRQ